MKPALTNAGFFTSMRLLVLVTISKQQLVPADLNSYQLLLTQHFVFKCN